MHEIILTTGAQCDVRFKRTGRRKIAGILEVFRDFSTEERLRMILQWDARCRNYFMHDPKCRDGKVSHKNLLLSRRIEGIFIFREKFSQT